jgi:hypothetical protein
MRECVDPEGFAVVIGYWSKVGLEGVCAFLRRPFSRIKCASSKYPRNEMIEDARGRVSGIVARTLTTCRRRSPRVF